jgi:hypothetical protein
MDGEWRWRRNAYRQLKITCGMRISCCNATLSCAVSSTIHNPAETLTRLKGKQGVGASFQPIRHAEWQRLNMSSQPFHAQWAEPYVKLRNLASEQCPQPASLPCSLAPDMRNNETKMRPFPFKSSLVNGGGFRPAAWCKGLGEPGRMGPVEMVGLPGASHQPTLTGFAPLVPSRSSGLAGFSALPKPEGATKKSVTNKTLHGREWRSGTPSL